MAKTKLTMGSIDREIIVVEDADALAQNAARRIFARIEANAGRIAICLTGGSTPRRLYELLATPAWRSRMPWQRIDWFIGDERCVPLSDRHSNFGMARRTFLDACAPVSNMHPIPAADPDGAARTYESVLREYRRRHTPRHDRPLFDLVLMGIGPDGHTASLFPGYPATEEIERWAVGVSEPPVAPFLPRVTLTFPVLASCHEMLFLVSGAEKRGIVTRALADDRLPASRARGAESTVWLMDRAAAPDPPHD